MFPRLFRRALLAALWLAGTLLSHASEFSGLVAFGDSLSDMGNRGLNPQRSDQKFRQTWVARLTGPAMLNLPGFKPSGMQAFFGGTNYAVGGAGTAATSATASERNRPHDLTQQVSQRYLNPAFNSAGVLPGALHVVVIGANDVMVASIGLDQVLSRWANLESAGPRIAQSTEGQIRALAKAGARYVLWGNVFDVAQAPALRKRASAFPSVSEIYLAAVNRTVRAHNVEQDAAILRLRQEFPQLRLIKLDLFSRFTEVAANPRQFGFTDVTTGANDNDHLFSADGLHPTPQGHKMLADFAFAVLRAEVPHLVTATP